MFHSRPATANDFEQLRDVFERASDAPYPIGPVLAEKLLPGYMGEVEATVAIDEGKIIAAMVRCGGHLRLLAVSREHRGRGMGSRLLLLAEQQAAAQGIERLVVAAEPGNYFTPGIWRLDARSVLFFERRGYTITSEPVNLTVSLAGNPLLDRYAPDPNITAASHDERAEITEWIAGEFGRIWAFEAGRSFEHPQPSLFIHREGSEIRGFSAHCANNAVLGTYGPAGVGRQWRRSGCGRGLLLASLIDLRERGFTEAIIQWASALNFYERSCGATISERFVVLEKSLK